MQLSSFSGDCAEIAEMSHNIHIKQKNMKIIGTEILPDF
jgi:hypothetical protein